MWNFSSVIAESQASDFCSTGKAKTHRQAPQGLDNPFRRPTRTLDRSIRTFFTDINSSVLFRRRSHMVSHSSFCISSIHWYHRKEAVLFALRDIHDLDGHSRIGVMFLMAVLFRNTTYVVPCKAIPGGSFYALPGLGWDAFGQNPKNPIGLFPLGICNAVELALDCADTFCPLAMALVWAHRPILFTNSVDAYDHADRIINAPFRSPAIYSARLSRRRVN